MFHRTTSTDKSYRKQDFKHLFSCIFSFELTANQNKSINVPETKSMTLLKI